MTQREYKLGEIVSVKVYIDDIYCLETAKIIEITKNIFGKKRYLVLFEDNQIMNCSSRRFINHS